MPTPGERRALIFIAAIAALGVAVRGFGELRGGGAAPVTGDRAGLARQIDAVDSAIASGGARRGRDARARGAAAPNPKKKSRSAESPRGSQMPPEWPPEARYPKEWVAPAPPARDRGDARRQRQVRTDTARAADARRRATGESAAAASRRLSSPARAAPVDLDTAPVDEVASVPSIGPALARRIVADRIEHGPFGSMEGLERVRGISRALARRFQPHVTFSLPPRSGDAPEQAAALRKSRRP
jgi:competence protein ComEA